MDCVAVLFILPCIWEDKGSFIFKRPVESFRYIENLYVCLGNMWKLYSNYGTPIKGHTFLADNNGKKANVTGQFRFHDYCLKIELRSIENS